VRQALDGASPARVRELVAVGDRERLHYAPQDDRRRFGIERIIALALFAVPLLGPSAWASWIG
jgi:hypothetical protein